MNVLYAVSQYMLRNGGPLYGVPGQHRAKLAVAVVTSVELYEVVQVYVCESESSTMIVFGMPADSVPLTVRSFEPLKEAFCAFWLVKSTWYGGSEEGA